MRRTKRWAWSETRGGSFFVRPENFTAPMGMVRRPAPEEEEVVGAIVSGLGTDDEGLVGEGVVGVWERLGLRGLEGAVWAGDSEGRQMRMEKNWHQVRRTTLFLCWAFVGGMIMK